MAVVDGGPKVVQPWTLEWTERWAREDKPRQLCPEGCPQREDCGWQGHRTEEEDFCSETGVLSMLHCRWEEVRESQAQTQPRGEELSLELGTPTHDSDAKRHVYRKQMKQKRKGLKAVKQNAKNSTLNTQFHYDFFFWWGKLALS